MITRAAHCLLLWVLCNGLITSRAFQVSPTRLTVSHPFSTATAITSPSYRTHWVSTALYESSKSQQQQQQQQQKGNKVAKSQHVQLMATYLSHQLVSVLKKNPSPSKKIESTTQQQDSVDGKTSSLMDVKDATSTAAGTASLQRDDAPETYSSSSSSLTPRDDVEELQKTIQEVQDVQQKAESVIGAQNLAQVAFSESTDPNNNQVNLSNEVSNTDNDNEVDGASTGGEKASSFKTLLKAQIDADSRRKQQMDAEKSESLHKKEGDRILALKDEFMTGDDDDNAVDNVDTVLQDPEPLTVKEESAAIEQVVSNEQVDSSSTGAETIALPVEDEPKVEETVALKEETTFEEKEEQQKEEDEKGAIIDMESSTSETVDSSIDQTLDEDTAGEVELEAVTEAVSTAEDVDLATSEPAQDTSDQKIEDTTVSKVEEQVPTLEVVVADAAVQDAEISASNASDAAAATVPQSDEPMKAEEVLVTAKVEEGEIEDSHDEAVISKDAAPVPDLHPSTTLKDLSKEEGAVTEMLDKTGEDVEKDDSVDLSVQEPVDNDATTPTAEVASDETTIVEETKETPSTAPPAAVTITMPESLAVKVANDFYDARGMFIPKKPSVISDAFGKPLEVIKAGVPPLREAMTRPSTAVAAAAPSSSTPPPTSLKAVMTKPGQLLEPATFSLEEQAFATLRDLGMIKETPNPCDEHYDHSDDDILCPENKWKS